MQMTACARLKGVSMHRSKTGRILVILALIFLIAECVYLYALAPKKIAPSAASAPRTEAAAGAVNDLIPTYAASSEEASEEPLIPLAEPTATPYVTPLP